MCKKSLFVLFIFLVSTGCDPDPDKKMAAIPDVSFSCSSGNCSDASGTESFMVAWVPGGCGVFWDNDNYNKAYSLNSGEMNGSVSGTASSWIESTDQNSISELEEGTYSIVIYVALMGSDEPVTGDVKACYPDYSLTGNSAALSVTDEYWEDI
jgi:hypothetical protein